MPPHAMQGDTYIFVYLLISFQLLRDMNSLNLASAGRAGNTGYFLSLRPR